MQELVQPLGFRLNLRETQMGFYAVCVKTTVELARAKLVIADWSKMLMESLYVWLELQKRDY